jgi:phosphoglycolate phosphatase
LIKTVIFDLDGTLVYQPPGIILESNVKVVESFAPDYPDPVAIVREVYAETSNNGGLLVTKAEQVKCMAEKLSVDVDENKIREGLKTFLENYLAHLKLHEDCLPTLKRLETKGYRMGIATNGAHDVQPRTIEKFGIESYFDFVVISSEVKASKDTKSFVRYLIDKCGIKPEETIVVGDTLPDFLLAKGLESMVYIVDRDQSLQYMKSEQIRILSLSEQQQLSGKAELDKIPQDIIIPTLSIIPEMLEQIK